jgi:nitroimidazol reductase NimA-like FMN-containing flavoprotein (pyridoxamine 5'-phosphate oxidase superfamily)
VVSKISLTKQIKNMLGVLNDTQIKNLLSSQVVGRLACTDGSQPYIVPVTYSYDGKYIYGQTNEGLKLDILRSNSNVCFEVDAMTDMRNWQSVVVYGIFEELVGDEANEAKDIFFNRVLPLMTSYTLHPYGHEVNNATVDDSNRVKNVMYRILITRITGRFEKQ